MCGIMTYADSAISCVKYCMSKSDLSLSLEEACDLNSEQHLCRRYTNCSVLL